MRAFMQLLLQFSDSTPYIQQNLPLSTLPRITARPRHNNQLVCRECQDDEDIVIEHRHRHWKCNAHLQRHVNSDFHSLRNRFLRRIQAETMALDQPFGLAHFVLPSNTNVWRVTYPQRWS